MDPRIAEFIRYNPIFNNFNLPTYLKLLHSNNVVNVDLRLTEEYMLTKSYSGDVRRSSRKCKELGYIGKTITIGEATDKDKIKK